MRSMAKSTASWTVAKVRGPMLSVRQWSRSRIVLPPWCQHHQQARRRSSGSSGNGVGITNGTNPWRSLPTNYSPGWSASGRERGLAANIGGQFVHDEEPRWRRRGLFRAELKDRADRNDDRDQNGP